MAFGHVVDQFHDKDGFTNARTTEQTNFTTFGVRRDKVDDLNAGNQNFGVGRLIDESRSFAVNR